MANEQNKQNQGTESNVTSIGSAGNKSGAGSAASTKTAPQNSAAAGNESANTGTSNQSTTESGGVTGTVKSLYNKAKDSAVGHTAGEVYGQAKDKAANVLDERKSTVATGLTSVADSLRQVGDNLNTPGTQDNQIANLTAKYSGSLAGQVERLSGYLENKDLREMMRDVETFARRNPAIFLGGAFALGLLAARFLKSANPNQAMIRRPKNDDLLRGNTGNTGRRNLSGAGSETTRNLGGSGISNTGTTNTGTKDTGTKNIGINKTDLGSGPRV